MRIEVILLLYNRFEHALAVIDSLVKARVPRVRAFMDHSDDPKVQGVQHRLLERIADISEVSIEVHRHDRRHGLAKSVRFALDTVLADADAAVVLEDDCVLRPGAFEFFREGLATLKHDRRVRSLCGYLFPCPFIRSASEPLLLRRFCTWGWATWRNRWHDYDPDLSRAIGRLKACGIRVEDVAHDLASLCRSSDYLENRVDIWSIPWILEHFTTSTFCVYPSDSMIDNIGFDGTGENCHPSADFLAIPADSPRAWNFSQLYHCTENEEMLKAFMQQHGAKTYPPA